MSDSIQIIEFEDVLSNDFRKLSIAWLQKYFVVEPIDEEMLSKPHKFIIDKGGHIFFAKIEDEVVGTFAMMKSADNEYELSKMAVSEEHQGKKIGNKMLEFCLDKARELKAKKVILFSNTMLEPAIHLYRKYGFKEVPLRSSEYKRSNIKMEVEIKEPS
jgi:ribosomal protein S18 acetylase RimI-like enzyme